MYPSVCSHPLKYDEPVFLLVKTEQNLALADPDLHKHNLLTLCPNSEQYSFPVAIFPLFVLLQLISARTAQGAEEKQTLSCVLVRKGSAGAQQLPLFPLSSGKWRGHVFIISKLQLPARVAAPHHTVQFEILALGFQ